MDSKDWMIITTIYETKNITKAAKKLFTSQPALSYRLKQIESNLKVKIIDIHKNELTFTPEGEYLAAYCRRMLIEYQQLQEELANMSQSENGIIRLGVSSNFALYKLPGLLTEFNLHYPSVRFIVKSGWSSQVYQSLLNREIHIGITREDFGWTEQKHLIHQDQLCIISNKKIEIDALPKLPRISIETNPTNVKLIETWWRERFREPSFIAMEVDKLETCKEMVKNGLGYAFIPSIGLSADDHLQKVDLNFNNGLPLINHTWLLYRDCDMKILIVEKFVEFIKKVGYPQIV